MFNRVKTELLSGLVVAISLIPESIGFSFVLGLNPMVGILTSVIMGIVTSFIGGRPAMITAATGAISAVYVGLVRDHGVEYLYAAVILAGIIQLVLSYFNIGKLIRLVSKPIMIGFLNGLAIIILLAQLKQFQNPDTNQWLEGVDLLIMLMLVILTIIIVKIVPKFFQLIPSTLIAIVIVTSISLMLSKLGFTIFTVADYAKTDLIGYLPPFHIPKIPFNFETLGIILIPALSASIVGIIESLLTLNVLDEVTNTRGDTQKEVRAQGVANMVVGFFSGMGGCALLGQSNINVNNGARSYISSFFAAIALLAIVFFGSDLLGVLPLGVLAGIMFVVVINTFAWETLYLRKIANKSDLLIAGVVTIVVVITHNLAIGVMLGIILSVFKFAWDKSKKLKYHLKDNTLVLNGVIFFATSETLKLIFDELIFTKIDFKDAKILDYSAASEIVNYIKKKNYEIEIINLDEDSKHLINRLEYGFNKG